MTIQKTPWDLDVRVRERNIRKGVLDDKDVEKYLKELPDTGANAETVTIPQPAVAGSAAAVAAAAAPMTAAPMAAAPMAAPPMAAPAAPVAPAPSAVAPPDPTTTGS